MTRSTSPPTNPSSLEEESSKEPTGASRRALIGLFSATVGSAVLPRTLQASNAATSVRMHDHGTHTRLVVELTEGLGFKVFSLSQPYRMVVDLPEVKWQLSTQNQPLGTGVVRDIRYGLFQPGQSRIVLDLNEPANVQRAFLLAATGSTPWRMVIDLVSVSEAAFLGRSGPAKGLEVFPPNQGPAAPSKPVRQAAARGPNADERIPLPQRKPAVLASNSRPVIAIDPGHGGIDPGAIGVSGVREKDIALAAGRELKKALEQTGRYKVVLTRTRDVSLGLRQRIARARRAAADIFISLHADSIGRSDVRGLSVYTLSERASDREAAALADKENKADLIIGMDLSNESDDIRNILIDLAQRESLNLAAHLAAKLIAELRRQVKLLRNTHRFAGFAVLKAPDVPSVLLEMGYLSNREEERALRQASYRGKLILSIIRALDGYFSDMDVIRPT